MTIGLKTPSIYYIELINTFPPRPITNEADLIATQNRINYILDQGNLTQDDKDYLKVLGTLVYDYEQNDEPMPTLRGVELLKALLEESNLQLNPAGVPHCNVPIQWREECRGIGVRPPTNFYRR